jgi:hypothetical protein
MYGLEIDCAGEIEPTTFPDVDADFIMEFDRGVFTRKIDIRLGAGVRLAGLSGRDTGASPSRSENMFGKLKDWRRIDTRYDRYR